MYEVNVAGVNTLWCIQRMNLKVSGRSWQAFPSPAGR
jgi:hypothetical protein